MMTSEKPKRMDMSPFLMESEPRVGLTVHFCRILTEAGREPALRTMARSVASSGVKVPVISALPPAILSRI
jgi:hypothetical protein